MCCRPRHRCRSQLPGQREGGGGESRQSDSGTRHAPLSISILMPSTCSCSPLLGLFCILPLSTSLSPLWKLLLYHLFLTITVSFSHTNTHTHTSAAFWNTGEKKEGEDKEEEVGFGRMKGGERQGGVERNRHRGPAATAANRRERTAEKTACWLAGAFAPSNRNRVWLRGSELPNTENLQLTKTTTTGGGQNNKLLQSILSNPIVMQ